MLSSSRICWACRLTLATLPSSTSRLVPGLSKTEQAYSTELSPTSSTVSKSPDPNSQTDNEQQLDTKKQTIKERKPHAKLDVFFDDPKNWGKTQVITGRPWQVDELRLRTNGELHKLWYVLLRERNMLLSMAHAAEQAVELLPNPERLDKVEYVLLRERNMLLSMAHAAEEAVELLPNPERLDKVELSMQHVETVVRERNRAVTELETGHTGLRPVRRVTTFLGFTVEKDLEEHLVPSHMNTKHKKEYETPYMDEDAYMFQKYWQENKWIEDREKEDDRKLRLKQHKYIYKY